MKSEALSTDNKKKKQKQSIPKPTVTVDRLLLLEQQNKKLKETIKFLKTATQTNTNTSNDNDDDATKTEKHTSTGYSAGAGAGGGDDNDSSSSSDNDSSVNSSSSDEGQQHAHNVLDSNISNNSNKDDSGNKDINIGGGDSNKDQILTSILKSFNRNQHRTLAFQKKRYDNQIWKESAVGSLPPLKKLLFLIALLPHHRIEASLLILIKDLKFTKTFRSIVKDKSVDKIFGQINDVVNGRRFSIKKARFVAFVKTEGVLPPTGSSFGGLSVFSYSPNTYQHTVAEHQRKLKLKMDSKEDDEECVDTM